MGEISLNDFNMFDFISILKLSIDSNNNFCISLFHGLSRSKEKNLPDVCFVRRETASHCVGKETIE